MHKIPLQASKEASRFCHHILTVYYFNIRLKIII